MPHFLDTNVLLYAISPHPEEAKKRAQADALVVIGAIKGALGVRQI